LGVFAVSYVCLDEITFTFRLLRMTNEYATLTFVASAINGDVVLAVAVGLYAQYTACLIVAPWCRRQGVF